MYSVLIVDDELLVRRHLRTLIDWESYGFFIAGEASNGKEALEFIAQHRTDAVLSDVLMPLMNGVELISEIQRLYPHIPFIMLSNYDDFAYVRSALHHGALDYVLKHMLDERVLSDSLQQLRTRLKENENRLGQVEYQMSATQVQALKQRFVIQLLSRYFKQEAEITAHIRTQRLALEVNNVVPIVIELDQLKNNPIKRDLKEEELLYFSVLNILEEVLADNENGIAASISPGRFVALLSYANIRSDIHMEHRTRGVVNRIDQCLKRFAKVQASFSIGSRCASIKQVPDNYELACQKLTEKFYLGPNCMIFPDQQSELLLDKMTGLDLKQEKGLLANLKIGDVQAVKSSVDTIFMTIRRDRLSPIAAQMIFNELLGIVNRICKENQIEAESAYAVAAPPHEIMASLETLDEIQIWITGIFDRLVGLIHHSEDRHLSPSIRKAVGYMKKHLHESLSLGDVAEHLQLSHTYLSTLFKEEQGVGFLDYLMELRLDKAKALLLEEKLELKEIAAACGFQNYPYFFNVFKKRVGVTPGSYVQRNKS